MCFSCDLNIIKLELILLFLTIWNSFKIISWKAQFLGFLYLADLPVFIFLALKCVCIVTIWTVLTERVCVCMVRYTKGGSWQGYRGNTVCVWCVDELLPFSAIYPRDGHVVNYSSPTRCRCKRCHPWPRHWRLCSWGRRENITLANSSVIYVQTVCSSSNYHSASSS